ncbi:hypothetical protein ASA1KI_27110 [Opitutales bacterium ASA1]|nr:hypothetical protein ASA1KI_27110 [Opitutales bacterium ASA1]
MALATSAGMIAILFVLIGFLFGTRHAGDKGMPTPELQGSDGDFGDEPVLHVRLQEGKRYVRHGDVEVDITELPWDALKARIEVLAGGGSLTYASVLVEKGATGSDIVKTMDEFRMLGIEHFSFTVPSTAKL